MICAAAALWPAAASAQGWTLEAGAGGAVHDPLAARISSTTASLGINFEGDTRWAYVSAGAPLSEEGPAWGAAGGGGWWPASRTLGLWLSADAFGYGAQDSVSSGGGVSGRLLPALVLAREGLRAELGAGALGMALTEGDSTGSRVLGEASLQLGWTGQEGVSLGAGGRYLTGDGLSAGYLGATGELRGDRGSLWAEAGTWLTEDLPGPHAALGVGGQLFILSRTSVAVSWQQDPSEPLFRNAPRRSWSVSLRQALGGGPPAAAGGRRPVATVRAGSVVFRVPRGEHPQAPALLGDLTGWQPVTLSADGDSWTVSLPVRPGVYHYVFRTPSGGTWLPPGTTRSSDGFGGFNAVLVIP